MGDNNVFYISRMGKDTNKGNSPKSPFASFSRVKEAVRGAIETGR